MIKIIEQKANSQSGTVKIEGNDVRWYYKSEIVFSLQLSDVMVVGEYTNSDGPHLEDWFLVLVTTDKSYYQISMYADNIDNLLEILALKYHAELVATQLANSTEWKSIVMYPVELNGQPLFIVTRSEYSTVPKNIGHRFLRASGFEKFDFSEEVSLSPDIKQYIDSACR